MAVDVDSIIEQRLRKVLSSRKRSQQRSNFLFFRVEIMIKNVSYEKHNYRTSRKVPKERLN